MITSATATATLRRGDIVSFGRRGSDRAQFLLYKRLYSGPGLNPNSIQADRILLLETGYFVFEAHAGASHLKRQVDFAQQSFTWQREFLSFYYRTWYWLFSFDKQHLVYLSFGYDSILSDHIQVKAKLQKAV